MKKRLVYYDILRIIATFAVIIIHVSAENWSTTTIDNNWLINNFINSLVHCWAVPMFVTISGALLLNKKNFTLKNMIKKYIPRILICLVIWHFIYYFFSVREFSLTSIIHAIKALLLGNTYSHLWYLYLVIGLYLITPVLSKMLKNLSNTELLYLLTIGFIVQSLIPTIELITKIELMQFIWPYKIFDFSYFILYYILGYYLSQNNIRYSKIIFALSIIMLIGVSILSNINSINSGIPISYSTTENFISVLLVTSMFSVVKEKYGNVKNDKITCTGKLMFGVYLIHFLIEKILLSFGLHANIINPICGNLLISTVVFIISFIIVYIVSKIPIIKKIVL